MTAAAVLTMVLGVGPLAASASGQTLREESGRVAHAIKWVPIRTAVGVAAENDPVPQGVAVPRLQPGQAYTFEALDIDADGQVQETEWTLAATDNGLTPGLAIAQFGVLDDDRDGALSQDEFERMSPGRFAAAARAGVVGTTAGQAPNVVYSPVIVYRVEGG
ncbi:MAG: hypothetical protein AAFX81_19640 [Pseudomonadota bacterium]